MPRIALPFIGPAYRSRSLNASAQRCVNLYLEAAEQGQEALYGTPGTVLRATCGSGPVRGMLAAAGYAWIVSGNRVYRLQSDMTPTLIGTIGTTAGRVGMAANPLQLLIVDGKGGYLVDLATFELTTITDVDFPAGVSQCCYIDGYFVVAGDGTGRFYINEFADNGSSWNGTDFATAEGAPDTTLNIAANHRELWLVGELSTEVWINTGNATFPFERSSNVFIEHGAAASWTLAKIDNTVFWLGADSLGKGIVYSANGYTPARISTHAIEYAISQYPTLDDAFAFAYQQEGHAFYVLSFPSGGETWVYDASVGAWHQRAWFNALTGELERWRPSHHCFALGLNLVGTEESGDIYSLDLDAYTDDGAPIKRVRAAQSISERQLIQFFSMFQVSMETGVGSTAQESPAVVLRYSNDAGHTWSDPIPTTAGAAGEYAMRAVWWRLGSGRNRVWEVSTTDPVKIAILGAVLEGSLGGS